MVQAKDAGAVEKHLPVAFVQAIQRLREPHRSKVRSRFVFRSSLPADVQITIGGGDNLLLSAEWKEESQVHQVKVKVEDEATSNAGTLLKLALCQNSECETYYLQMKYEEGDWRLTRIDAVSKVVNLDSALLRYMQGESSESSSPNEASAIGNLRSINTALIQYQSNYPEIGYPRELGSLGPPIYDEPDAERAGLLVGRVACPRTPCLSSGYRFDYSPRFFSDHQGYAVVARPEHFGRTGTRSFFTDESGVIRYTDEGRPASEDDPPLP